MRCDKPLYRNGDICILNHHQYHWTNFKSYRGPSYKYIYIYIYNEMKWQAYDEDEEETGKQKYFIIALTHKDRQAQAFHQHNRAKPPNTRNRDTK